MMCHRYKKLYKEKLKAKKVPEKIEKDLEVLEQDLDVLNITICRRAAEREVFTEEYWH